MSRFSTIYIAQSSSDNFYSRQELFKGLELLHKLWFQINELDKRLSGRADDRKNNLVADFHVLANKLINQILNIYTEWSDGHSKDGWWSRWAEEELKEFGVIDRGIRGTIDIRPKVQEIIEEQIVRENDWRQEFEDTEYSWAADKFLFSWIIKNFPETKGNAQAQRAKFDELVDNYVGRNDEEKAYDYIKDNAVSRSGRSLMDEFYEWSIENHNFNPRDMVSLDDLYGDDWWNLFYHEEDKFPYQHDLLMRVLNDPQLKEAAWDQWLQMWPGYEETRKQVNNIIDKLNAVRGTADINQIMSTISLALNVAHNSGLMYEHLGLNKDQMEDLSNLDTSSWSQEIKHYSKKILAIYTNPETFIREPSAITFSVSGGTIYTAPSFESHVKLRKDNGLMSVELEGRISKDRNVCAVWNKGFGDNVYNATIASALDTLYNKGLINMETGIFITGSRINGQPYSQFLKEYAEQEELGNVGNSFSL